MDGELKLNTEKLTSLNLTTGLPVKGGAKNNESLPTHYPRYGRVAISAHEAGFSTGELAIVVTILLVFASLAIPASIRISRALRASTNVRAIASQLALAKMTAANGFTQSRLNCDVTARSCQLEVCTTKGTSSCNTFSAEGGPILLSDEMSFGFGSVTTPAGTQTTIQNTPQIIFNSRSLPVDSTGAPTGNYALYLTNPAGDKYAVTVYATGRVAVWEYRSDSWNIQ